jgi:transcription antitermination factor NusG
MQNNWYVVYTKPNCEKKVSSLFTKKGFVNFVPFHNRNELSLMRRKTMKEPLFKAYVFVKATENDIIALSKRTKCIINLLYWMGKPAIISEDEIRLIREFTNDHQEINLEKFEVNLRSERNINEGISYTLDGKILMIKNKAIKVNLPSLGYTMVARIEDESIMGREIAFGQKEAIGQS